MLPTNAPQALAHGIADWAAVDFPGADRGRAAAFNGGASANGGVKSSAAAANAAWAAIYGSEATAPPLSGGRSRGGAAEPSKGKLSCFAFLWDAAGEKRKRHHEAHLLCSLLHVLAFLRRRAAQLLPCVAERAAKVARMKDWAREFISELFEEDALKLTYLVKMTSARSPRLACPRFAATKPCCASGGLHRPSLAPMPLCACTCSPLR